MIGIHNEQRGVWKHSIVLWREQERYIYIQAAVYDVRVYEVNEINTTYLLTYTSLYVVASLLVQLRNHASTSVKRKRNA